MDWLYIILPIVTLVLGWFLSEIGTHIHSKRVDKRKLKKLLFNLLELRYLLNKDLEFGKTIDILVDQLKRKMPEAFQEASEIEIIKPFLIQLLKDKLVNPKQIIEVTKNIDNTIEDLSEIFPIFAYELRGQFNVKERLQKFSNYIEEVENKFHATFDIKKHFAPKLADELLDRFDENIMKLSKLINRKIFKQTRDKIKLIKLIDMNGADKYIDELITIIQN